MELNLFDLQGRKITTLEKRLNTSGTHTIDFGGTDSQGNAIPAGIYLLVFSKDGIPMKTAKLVKAG